MENMTKVGEAPNEIAMIAAIITYHCIDEFYKQNQGLMHTYEAICFVAQDFFNQYKHITEWEEESAKQKCDDWEGCIIKFAQETLNGVGTRTKGNIN